MINTPQDGGLNVRKTQSEYDSTERSVKSKPFMGLNPYKQIKKQVRFEDDDAFLKQEKIEEQSEHSTVFMQGVTQLEILLSSPILFFIMISFFVSTCLWVYLEPILSLHLKDHFMVQDFVTPLFFFIFSTGYLAASLTLFLTNVSEWSARWLSSSAYVLTGLCHMFLVL